MSSVVAPVAVGFAGDQHSKVTQLRYFLILIALKTYTPPNFPFSCAFVRKKGVWNTFYESVFAASSQKILYFSVSTKAKQTSTSPIRVQELFWFFWRRWKDGEEKRGVAAISLSAAVPQNQAT